MAKLTKNSCKHCGHWYICRFKPEPYMGTCSGGIKFNVSYERFAQELFELYGKHCNSFIPDSWVEGK